MSPPDRQPQDTPKSYAALCAYAGMGPDRSLDKVRQQIGMRSVRILEQWSSAHNWQARVAAYDAAEQAQIDAERSAIRRRRRLELEELDWQQGGALRARVAELLDEMPKFLRRTEHEVRQDGELVKVITLALAAGPAELARAIETASKIQRLSVGEATAIHQLVESELESFFDVLKHNLAPDEYARIVDLARRGPASGG